MCPVAVTDMSLFIQLPWGEGTVRECGGCTSPLLPSFTDMTPEPRSSVPAGTRTFPPYSKGIGETSGPCPNPFQERVLP